MTQLAHTVLLITESAGSFTELGTFSYSPLIESKMIVVANNRYLTDKSFIALGPLKHLSDKYYIELEDERSLPVLKYDWNDRSLAPDSFSDINSVYENIKSILKARKGKIALDSDNNGHLLHLIADLIDLFVFQPQKNIRKVLKQFNVNISPKIIRQLIYVLYKAEIIDKLEYGSDTYWYSKDRHKFIEYAGFKLDRSKFKVNVTEVICSQKNDHLFAYNRYLGVGV